MFQKKTFFLPPLSIPRSWLWTKKQSLGYVQVLEVCVHARRAEDRWKLQGVFAGFHALGGSRQVLVTRVMHWWPLWGEARADPQETKPAPMKPLQDPAEPTTHCPCENIFKKGQKLWTSRAVNTQVREEGEEEVLQVPRQSFACRPWRGPWLIRLSLCCPWWAHAGAGVSWSTTACRAKLKPLYCLFS